MKQIDEARLEEDLAYRYDYLTQFIGFTADDAAAIHAFAPHLGPRIAPLVDKTYERLLEFDATARHFVPRQHGAEVDETTLDALHADHPQIQFRKDHLQRYFMQLIGRSYDAKMVEYLDIVGKMHTSKAGNKTIIVPLVQMNALLGLLTDLLFELIYESPLDDAGKSRTLRAFNKLLWIQADLVSRHYMSQE